MGMRRRGFTLIELLVAAAVIMIILSIMLPSMHRARERANAAKCINNLRQCAVATASYGLDYTDALPYPVATRKWGQKTQDLESAMWFTALDKYLVTPRADDPSRQNVAGKRSYRKWKECVVWEGFPSDSATPAVNTGQTIKEYARTIKMNSHLRRVGGEFARNTDIDKPNETVLYADGTSYDTNEWPKNTSEAGQFSLDVNTGGVGGIAIRHLSGANVVFVDGHA
jgi:prepilin-type N-terminal cleavage/methylation domain-containing protein/prepilin-type processing-associated H-X9-DG protein